MISGANAEALPTHDRAEGLFAELEGLAHRAAPGALLSARLELGVAPEGVPSGATLAWLSPGSRCYASGEAAVVVGDGENRWDQVLSGARALFSRIHGPARPRLFGGFAFDDRNLSGTPWSELGGARFVLPRWQLVASPDRVTLDLVTHAPRDATELERIRAELNEWLDPRPPLPTPRNHEAPALGDGDDDYRARVADIIAAIDSGRFQKIVAARCSEIDVPSSFDPSQLMSRLALAQEDCFRFVFRAGRSLLFGAPPELLVRVKGRAVESEALAGSIASTAPGAAAVLLASDKDRREQDLVVRAIERELSPLCSSLEVPPTPEVRSLRHVLHLRSRIRGVLGEPRHIVELCQRLHPTPAVGGTPSAEAREWIAEHEPGPRGWYAAPVGWFDESGDGELAVAIRSALVHDDRAYLYAGAGIVADSVPELELAETRLKQRAMLEALGVGM